MMTFIASSASEVGEVGAVDDLAMNGLSMDGFGQVRRGDLDIEKILEQLFAMLGQNGLGMELHAVGRVLTMFERHDLAFGCLRDDLKLGWDGFVNDERVIAHGFERRRDVFEDTLSVVSDGGGLAVHEARSAVHFAAVDSAEALMSEADAEHGDFAREVFDGFRRNAAIFDGFAWAWGDDEMVRLEGDQLVQEIWSLRKTRISAPSSPRY
jgi:hypothetical protein